MLFYSIDHNTFCPEFRERITRMTFKITVQIALVRKSEFIDQLLKALMGIHQCHLQFNDCIVVYYLLCVLTACTLAYGIQMTGRDLQPVGIELHRTVLPEILCKQYTEFVEHLLLLIAHMLPAVLLTVLVYALHIQQ